MQLLWLPFPRCAHRVLLHSAPLNRLQLLNLADILLLLLLLPPPPLLLLLLLLPPPLLLLLLDNLWLRYAGEDPTLAANYNWTIVDECVRAWYFNPTIPVEMFVRFGHSHANHSLHPYFATPPDDFNVFAGVCLGIVRHLNSGWDSGWNLAVRDFTVWNEPSSTIELGGDCPFWTGSARQYAELYAAVYRAIMPEFGAAVRIGAAVNGALSQEQCPPLGASVFDHCFDWHILTNISVLGVPLDFAEFHWYGRKPALLPQILVAEGARALGKLSLEGSLVAAGFPRSTPILLGEWSRFIPVYAMDAPGAAFLACCLVGLNRLHPVRIPLCHACGLIA